MLDPTRFHGIIPPICTPLTSEGAIDIPSVHSLIDYLLDNGVHGLFAFGSTGECTSLTGQQRKILLEAVLAAEIIEHFRRIHKTVGLPIMAYDIPATVIIKLEGATIRQLYEEGVIIGLKDSSGVIDALRHTLLRMRGTDFRIFTGSELLVDLCLRMGAHGGVPGVANLFPAEFVRLYDLTQAGEWDSAARLQERLLLCFYELIAQGDSRYSGMSSALGGFKSGLKQKGVIRSTRVAEPLQSFGAVEEERVAEAMRRHGFL